MASPFLYYIDDRLSLAELTAARLDGDVFELGEAYIPADAVETRALRAGSLAEILGDTLAATHLSAAWVHGALHGPPPGTRSSEASHAGCTARRPVTSSIAIWPSIRPICC